MPNHRATADCLVVGGGVIGLSIAYRLAADGAKVAVLERGEAGREASWAGAGIVPAGSWYCDHPAMEALAAEAAGSQAEWSEQLHALTGVDDEYVRCGAHYYESAENSEYLRATFQRWVGLGIEVSPAPAPTGFEAAWRVPQEAQVRNPRRLRALVKACRILGVRVETHSPALRFRAERDQVDAVETPEGEFSAAEFVLAAGCWSPGLVADFAAGLGGRPVRGQMLLLRPRERRFAEIRHAYPYYLVPRRDGRVLVGATVEEAGFARGTTEEARRELEAATEQLAPGLLNDSVVEGFWSGLRPRGATELPVIGRLPNYSNMVAATGHFRSGLQLSTPTAELVASLIRGESAPAAAEAFAPRSPQPARSGP